MNYNQKTLESSPTIEEYKPDVANKGLTVREIELFSINNPVACKAMAELLGIVEDGIEYGIVCEELPVTKMK